MSWPSKVTKKVEIVKVWIFDSSPAKDPTVSIRNGRYSFVIFWIIPKYKFFLYLLFSGTLSPCRSFYDETIQILKFLFFSLPEIFWCSLDESHVYGRFFIFLNFFCKDRALILHLHTVAQRVSVTMSCRAKTTQMVNIWRLDFSAQVMQKLTFV